MITILVGLPGSGKTWYANNVLKYDVFLDDPRDFAEFPKTVNGHFVIADPLLCFEHTRAKTILPYMYPEETITYLFFENNPEKCVKNVEYRSNMGDNRDVLKAIKHLTTKYTIPEGVEPLIIWSPQDENTI